MLLVLVEALLKIGRQAVFKHIYDIACYAVQLLGKCFNFAGNTFAIRGLPGLWFVKAFRGAVTPRR
jgi:hypothetical protein